MSNFMIKVTKNVLIGGAILMDNLRGIFTFIGKAILGTFEIMKALPEGVRIFGLIGFLMLGRAGKGLVLLVGATIDVLRGFIGDLANAYAFFLEKINNGLEKTGMFKDQIANTKIVIDDFRKAAEKLKTPLKIIFICINKNIY